MAKPQYLKPETAAKKLGVYLPATPSSFRDEPMTRDDLLALQQQPPEWLATLRREGPHPRAVVAQKLGISTSGLTRAASEGVDTDALTTADIKSLLEAMPAWLAAERGRHARVQAENARVKAAKRAAAERT